jgi:hypothetical protein
LTVSARRVWLKAALALIPLALAAAGSLRLQQFVRSQLPVELLDCAPVLRERAHPGDRLIARKPHLAWLGGMESVPFPFANTLADLAAYARKTGARWLLVSWPEVETRPRYYYLLDTTAVVPGLVARKVTAPHPAVLYEIGPELGATPAWMQDPAQLAYHVARGRLLVWHNDVNALYALGLAEKDRGDLRAARNLLERARALAPRDFRVALELGDVRLRLQDFPGAAEALDQALALDPRSVAARIGRGWVSSLEGKPREAAETWRGVVDETPDPVTLRRMSGTFRSLGDTAAAALADRRAGRAKQALERVRQSARR